jgi:hypothetical protein
MNLKNLGRLFVFVFVLCFLFSSLGWSQTWDIPKRIKAKHKEGTADMSWKDLRKDLNHRRDGFKTSIERFFSEGKHTAIAKKLVNHDVVLFIGETEYNTFSQFEEYFEDKNESYTIALTLGNGKWVYYDGSVNGVEVDIIAASEFTIVLTPIPPASSDSGLQDPIEIDGEMTSFHRKICVWF